MTGFSADWLALREAADRRARNVELAQRAAHLLAGHSPLRVVDLGSGTGANLKITAPRLGPHQQWTLLDYDAALLAEARVQLSAWADTAEPYGDALHLTQGGKRIEVAFCQADLAHAPERIIADAPHLVTASAFFDLVSQAWISTFADLVARQKAVFFTVLTCDGRDRWQPPHPADAAITHGFTTHQAGDKGFGPAAGNAATTDLVAAFTRNGYEAASADSTWRLDPADHALIRALAAGTAAAAHAAGSVSAAEAQAWAEARAAATVCDIGHTDLLAWPGGDPTG